MKMKKYMFERRFNRFDMMVLMPLLTIVLFHVSSVLGLVGWAILLVLGGVISAHYENEVESVARGGSAVFD